MSRHGRKRIEPTGVHLSVSVRDVPAFMEVINAAAEAVRTAKRLGFITGDSPEIERLHRALECLSPEVGEDDG